jgi:hypothetical protein
MLKKNKKNARAMPFLHWWAKFKMRAVFEFMF